MEDLQLGVLFTHANIGVNTTLKDGSADSVGSHMGVGVRRNGRADIEPWRMVFEVGVEEVGVHGVDDIARDQEGVCIRAGKCVLDLGFREFLHDALNDAREEVATRTLAQQGADLFIVEEGDDTDLRGGTQRRVGVEQSLDGGPRAQLIVDAAGEDELAVETTSSGWLNIEQLQLPVDDSGVWR